MNALPFEYRIRRSARAQKARIIVSPSKVEVVAPHAMQESRIHRFVHDKREWIVMTLGKMARQMHARSLFAAPHFGDGALIPYQGKQYVLRIAATQLKRVKIEFDTGFTAYVPYTLTPDQHRHHIKTALTRWLWRRAEEDAQRLLQPHMPRFNLTPRSINIRTQKSRWGSCGIHNDLQLNWLLILAPPEIFEYVLVHELCHIRYKNHSRDFWNLVAEHLPDYKRHRAWLKTHGTALMQGL
ncbi:MAG: M48 family metallopeptidase [Gammaproteobacteria bacterium]